MSGAFDISKFMDMGTSEMGDTKFPVVPQGEYPGIVEKIDPKQLERKDGSGSFLVVEIFWKLNLSGEAAKKFGRENATVRQTIYPDIDSNGGLDMGAGKNVKLNQVREACGLVKGFTMGKLQGAGPALIAVNIQTNKNDPDKLYNDVSRVGKLK